MLSPGRVDAAVGRGTSAAVMGGTGRGRALPLRPDRRGGACSTESYLVRGLDRSGGTPPLPWGTVDFGLHALVAFVAFGSSGKPWSPIGPHGSSGVGGAWRFAWPMTA